MNGIVRSGRGGGQREEGEERGKEERRWKGFNKYGRAYRVGERERIGRSGEGEGTVGRWKKATGGDAEGETETTEMIIVVLYSLWNSSYVLEDKSYSEFE